MFYSKIAYMLTLTQCNFFDYITISTFHKQDKRIQKR